MTGNPQDLQGFIDDAINSDKTEICDAACKGDWRTPILIFTIAFIWEILLVFCAGMTVCAHNEHGGKGLAPLLMCGACTLVLIFIAGSIAVTVRSAESGCWGFYTQEQCRQPNVMPVLVDGVTYIANNDWCPMMWWHYIRWTWLLVPYYVLLVCCMGGGRGLND